MRRPGSAISSNTSTIALKVLTEGMSEAFRRDFLITHFFNPPRYMRLLEIVSGPETAPETVAAVARFADVALGKTIVQCQDSPGFIANRLGIYWLQLALIEAIDQGLTVEEADAIVGPHGHSQDRVFGLMDLVGIDLDRTSTRRCARCCQGPMRPIRSTLRSAADHENDRPGSDRAEREGALVPAGPVRAGARPPGDRPEHRRVQAGAETVAAGLDAAGRDLRILLLAPGKAGSYAFRVLAQTIAYAASLIPKRPPRSPTSMRRCASATTGNGGRSSLPTNWAWPG